MSLILSGSDGLSDVDGTAAAPAIRGTDANTGIFFPAADTIAFAEGGVEAARFDSAGNFGLGTTAPAVTLDTRSTSAAAARFSRSGTSGQLTSIVFEDGSATLGSGGTARIASSTGYLAFSTGGTSGDTAGGTERARIDSSGQFLVGATSNPGGGTSVAAFSGADVLNVNNTTAGTGSVTSVYFKRNATTVGSITVTGSATAYVTSSDYRLKENIAPMTGALANVALLKPVTYKWKVDGSDGQGFIAHELQAVVPDCVSGAKDAVGEQQYEVTPAVKDAEGRVITEAVMGTRIAPVYQGIDTSFLVATLTAAIQEQQALITALTTRITALEGAAA
jgi:hypothetical protein